MSKIDTYGFMVMDEPRITKRDDVSQKESELVVYDVAIIGGGASGLFAAWLLCERGYRVVLLEANDRVGKKLLATGNGRCNLTNINATPDKYNEPEFVKYTLERFGPTEIISAFEAGGLKTYTDSEGRVYPFSESSASVLNFFRKKMEGGDGCYPVQVETSTYVGSVRPTRRPVSGANGKSEIVQCSIISCADAEGCRRIYWSKNVIMATGSPAGFGRNSCNLLKRYRHVQRDFVPSLVPLVTERDSIKGLSGIRAWVTARLFSLDEDDKPCGEPIAEETGEVIFKDNGISGICILNLSAMIARNATECATSRYSVSLDFASGLSDNDARVALLLGGYESLLKPKLCEALTRRYGTVEEIGVDEAICAVRDYQIRVRELGEGTQSQVACGGLLTSYIDPESFKSLTYPNLYIVGEVLDVDGVCGGYNLTFAFSSAYSACKKIVDLT